MNLLISLLLPELYSRNRLYIPEPYAYLPQTCFLVCNMGIIIASPTSCGHCEDYMTFKHLLGTALWTVFSTWRVSCYRDSSFKAMFECHLLLGSDLLLALIPLLNTSLAKIYPLISLFLLYIYLPPWTMSNESALCLSRLTATSIMLGAWWVYRNDCWMNDRLT